MDLLELKFSEFTENYSLRLDSRFYSFIKRELPISLKTLKFPVIT